ncbi:hypothetical protein PR048_004099 [Dryococelus australis]|uniref:Uncharacterized protein n=1 Tax=Dryococelus australis TaxID=614101 RepID=A0ABQ9I4L3_9NEOP|nr:hypothetical protein PR048_004099 [Dryococelus australis]
MVRDTDRANVPRPPLLYAGHNYMSFLRNEHQSLGENRNHRVNTLAMDDNTEQDMPYEPYRGNNQDHFRVSDIRLVIIGEGDRIRKGAHLTIHHHNQMPTYTPTEQCTLGLLIGKISVQLDPSRKRNERLNPCAIQFPPPRLPMSTLVSEEGTPVVVRGINVYSNDLKIESLYNKNAKCNDMSVSTLCMDESERNLLLCEDSEDVTCSQVSLHPELNLKVCGLMVPTLLDIGAEISCVKEEVDGLLPPPKQKVICLFQKIGKLLICIVAVIHTDLQNSCMYTEHTQSCTCNLNEGILKAVMAITTISEVQRQQLSSMLM